MPKEWADKYKGKFDDGWDALREETIARQKQLGVIPADCELTARHKEISAWDDAPEAFKQVLRRQMEVYAGFMEYTDHHVGRLIDGLQKLGVLDDTLVYYIIGDNGASAEGGINGCFNEMGYFNGLQAFETPEYLGARLDKLGCAAGGRGDERQATRQGLQRSVRKRIVECRQRECVGRAVVGPDVLLRAEKADPPGDPCRFGVRLIACAVLVLADDPQPGAAFPHHCRCVDQRANALALEAGADEKHDRCGLADALFLSHPGSMCGAQCR